MAVAPTPADLRLWSDLPFDRYGYAAGATGDARLQLQLDRALSYLAFVTGREYGDAQTDSFPMVKTALDQATQMRTEQVVMALAADQLDTAADFDLVGSFSAGSYSETRRSNTADPKTRPLNPWPALNDLLWMLLSLFPGETNDRVLDRFDYWYALLTGIQTPAWQTVEVEWGRGMGLNEWGALPLRMAAPIPELNDSRIG